GTVDQLPQDVLSCPGGTQSLYGQLGAEPSVDREAARYVHERARGAELTQLGDVVPDHRHEASGPVTQDQAQVLAAIAAITRLDVAYQQHLRDVTTVCEVPDSHRVSTIE